VSPTDFTVTAATTTAVSSQYSSSCSVQVSTDTLRLRLSAQQLHACNALAAALSTAAAAAVEPELTSGSNSSLRAISKQLLRSHEQSVSSDLQRSDVTVQTCCSEAAAVTTTAGDTNDSTTVCEGVSDSDSSSTDASKWHTIEWVYAVPTRVCSVAVNSDAPALTAAANTVVLELGYIDVLRQDAFAVVWQRQLEFGSTTVAANSTGAANVNTSSMQRFDHQASNGAQTGNRSSRNTSASSGSDRWHFSDIIAAGVATAAAAPLAAVWQLRWTLVQRTRATSNGRSREYSNSSSSSDASGLTAVQIATWLQQRVLITSLQSPLARYASQIFSYLSVFYKCLC
jgi:hypothetical protein